MNELSKFLVEGIMLDENPIKKTVVIYVGRFQPMHKGHYAPHNIVVKKFGKDNVYVGTSDKVQLPKSPFNFKDKVKIMTTMFGIPKSKIHKVKNPYKPTEILKKFDDETTAFITVVGEKDKARLGGKYFQPYKGEPTEGYRDRGYVYAAPMSGGAVSGTEVRNGLSVGSDEQKKDFFKKRAYGKFNATIFSMITDKLDEGIEVSKEMIEEWLLNEGSKMGSGQSDDGPNVFFPNYEVFNKINVDRAKRIGYEVIDMITTRDIEDFYDHPTYPNGPVKAVTPFPAGVLGTQTATNQVDIYSSDAYSKWFKHVTRKASLVGYSIVNGLETNKDEKEQSLDSQAGDKKSQEEFENSLQEVIKLPVEIGDTLLMGKFKNKKVVVKTIGEDEHGLPTINGKKVVTFRYGPKKPNVFEVIFEDDETFTATNKKSGETSVFKSKDSRDAAVKAGTHEKSAENTNSDDSDEKDTKAIFKGKDGDKFRDSLPDDDPAKNDANTDKDGFATDFKIDIPTSIVSPTDLVRKKRKDTAAKIKNGYSKLKGDEKSYFKDVVKNPDKLKRSFVDRLKDKTKGAGKAIKDGLKHEYQEFKKAGGALKELGGGKKYKELDDGQKKALKLVGKSILITGAFAASGGVAGTVTGVAKLAGLTMAELVPHVAIETILKGIGRAAIFADEDQELEADLTKFSELIIKELENVELSNQMIATALDNFNKSKEEQVNEIAGTEVKCEKCNHSWEIESDDSEKYLCHSCGWDSQKQEYDFDAFESWQEKMGLNESKNFKLKVPSDIVKLQKQFKKNGKKLYIVGGAVRDAILGKSPKDFDLATDAKPEETMKIGKDGGFKTSQDVGTGMGLGIVIVGGHEVATFRKDIGKGRRPDSVEYTDIEGDVKRRDLTINALFYDIERKEIVDLVGGIADLKKKNIRTVGNAVERFDEDPLRKLRALRFQSRMGGSLDKELLDALQKDPSLKSLPAERIRDEFVKSLKTSKDTKKYMELCDKIGFTSQILPNLKINKPYIKTTDYIVFLSVLLKKNSPSLLGKLLNKLSYTNAEKNDIVFLVSLQYFKPEEVGVYKKLQQKTSLSDNQIVDFGKSIGKDMKKFVSFKLSVGGNDVPSDIKGAEIGLWIKNKERENFLNEMPMSDLQKIDKFADKQLNPVDTVLTGKHFFDRLNDPRNGKEVSNAELIGFFKRLGKKKKDFIKFLNQYNQIVVKDNRTNLNIPFMKQANKLIAKTIMRKDDFKSSDAKYTIESEDLDERGKMRPADRLRRKAAMAGKSKEIARRRARTMKRRKPLSKLKKIAYKMAYRQVYAEFSEELYPGIKKADLSIAQTQVVHKNVVRKKGRIIKRAKFRFLPALRAKEVEKFEKKNEDIVDQAFLKAKPVKEGRPIPMDTPNELVYLDFKKYAYKNRGMFKRELLKNKDNGGKMFLTLSALWYKWARKDNKEFTHIKDKLKFGRALMIMMVKDDVVFSKKAWKKTNQITNLKEGLKELGIKDFKSLFKKMPSDLQKRVYNLKNFGQRADKHPEGNVLKHTIMVVNRSINEDDIDIAIAAMFHDIGKDETAGIHPKKGHITHFGHEKVSASLVKKYKKFIEDVGGNAANVFYIVKNHMRYKQLSDMRPVKQDKLKSFRAFDKLGKFSKHDKGGLGESKEKENYLKESIDMIRLRKLMEEVLLQEGGAYGHMSHPFDTDINLTFGQLKDIVNRALEGTLEFTREKTDGQALAISWRDGRLVAARNKGHLKNRGENALDIKGVSDKFQGRGGLSDAYNYAMKDLSNAIKSLSDKQKDKVFKQGACFMNLEEYTHHQLT